MNFWWQVHRVAYGIGWLIGFVINVMAYFDWRSAIVARKFADIARLILQMTLVVSLLVLGTWTFLLWFHYKKIA